MYLEPQAMMISSAVYGIGPAVTGLSALMLIAVMLTYTYRPRTAPWRTVFWVILVANISGTAAVSLLGGRSGVVVAVAAGVIVLAARCNSNLRHAVQYGRARRDARLGSAEAS
ncbi:hypothetical protein GS504_01825 [Rhodococcus hoagii]|nr:hypothetical protein [Prescottella equi]NKS72238.1 hypothetical protein [Prescottella equi]